MPTTISLLWWNLYNLHDDIDDPRIHDIVRPTRLYHRDLREVADIVDRISPAPDVIGCAEVENHGVMRDLADEIHWRPSHHTYRCDRHIESRDPRGIDVGALVRVNPQLSLVQPGTWPTPFQSDTTKPSKPSLTLSTSVSIKWLPCSLPWSMKAGVDDSELALDASEATAFKGSCQL